MANVENTPVTTPRPTTWDKLKDAPSLNLPFLNGNITAVEFLTYLPSSLKSWDVVERFISNGANTPTLANIINSTRVMPYGPISHNTLMRTMQCTMRMRPGERYEGWTVLKHQRQEGWNERREGLHVGGFRTQAQSRPRKYDRWNELPRPVPFKDLAIGVKCIPSGHDALDLTRCIQHHQAHPNEDWYYPNDFQALVKHIGGPITVEDEHLDSHAFARWARPRRRTYTSHNLGLLQSTTPEISDENIERDTNAEEEAAVCAGNSKSRLSGTVEQRALKETNHIEKDGGSQSAMQDLPTAQKASVVWESESEMEEFRQSWANWKKHGIAGLAMPIVKGNRA